MWKNIAEPTQATDDSIAHSHCMLDNRLQTHPQNIYYLLLSTATVVARTRLNVMLYAHCLSCLTQGHWGVTLIGIPSVGRGGGDVCSCQIRSKICPLCSQVHQFVKFCNVLRSALRISNLFFLRRDYSRVSSDYVSVCGCGCRFGFVEEGMYMWAHK
jgi:hypothetical protein